MSIAMRITVCHLIAALTAMACGTVFCCAQQRMQSQPPPSPMKKGLVILVGGVGGVDFFLSAAEWALPHAGVPHQVVEFDWTHGFGKVFKDLQDTQHCLRKSRELSAYVTKVKRGEPERPIYLVGKSGGAGIVLAAAEQLPPMTVERIILLSAAVSPDFDLRLALRATRREIVSFNSSYDRLILGWGTTEFGTIDRFYGPSAGLKNFVIPKKLDSEEQLLYERLVQLSWNPRMILQGHTGGHLGTSMPLFLEKEVAPWLKP
jgi:pimeloyl-ACP methyl ester carboxylesterase